MACSVIGGEKLLFAGFAFGLVDQLLLLCLQVVLHLVDVILVRLLELRKEAVLCAVDLALDLLRFFGQLGLDLCRELLFQLLQGGFVSPQGCDDTLQRGIYGEDAQWTFAGELNEDGSLNENVIANGAQLALRRQLDLLERVPQLGLSDAARRAELHSRLSPDLR